MVRRGLLPAVVGDVPIPPQEALSDKAELKKPPRRRGRVSWPNLLGGGGLVGDARQQPRGQPRTQGSYDVEGSPATEGAYRPSISAARMVARAVSPRSAATSTGLAAAGLFHLDAGGGRSSAVEVALDADDLCELL